METVLPRLRDQIMEKQQMLMRAEGFAVVEHFLRILGKSLQRTGEINIGNVTKSTRHAFERLFLFAAAWSFGGSENDTGRAVVESELRKHFDASFPPLELGGLFDVFVDEGNNWEWKPWRWRQAAIVASITEAPVWSAHDMLVPEWCHASNSSPQGSCFPAVLA
jgi:hypothetical protein